MKLKFQWLPIAAILLFLLVLLGACGDRPKPTIVSQGRFVTETAVAILATTNAPPTAGPSPTPTSTSTPYMTATPFPNADPELVVAKVGSREVTLSKFQARVRYERWLPLYGLARVVERRGPETVLNLSLPENAQILALLYTLNSDPQAFGAQVMNALLTELVVLREASLRDLEMPQTVFDGRMAARIGVDLGQNGARPPEWDAAYDKFIADMQLYTGMTEAMFVDSMRALAFYDELNRIIGPQAEIPLRDITAVNVQDLILDSQEQALEAADRLRSGENILSIASSFGLQVREGENASQRTITRNKEGLPPEIITAIFNASPNDVLGPIATTSGWYVARVVDTTLDILQPSDIESARNEYFRQWIVQRLEDSNYTIDYDNWRDFVPTDPLPHDVSPLMHDENFTLPDDPFASGDEPTPTPLPIGISPR